MAQAQPTTVINEPIPQIVKRGRPPKIINGNGKHVESLELQVQEFVTQAGLVMPKTIVKRDGRLMNFDISKIENAISKCFDGLGTQPVLPISELARQVVNIVSAKYANPTVENVQDTVEVVLQAAGEFDAAKAYILYRAEHTKDRVERPIPDEVKDAFAKSDAYFPSPMQMFQFYDKYSRFNYELGRRETWMETVDRSVDFLKELSDSRLPSATYEKIRRYVLEMKSAPSMRLLAMAGVAARRQNLAIYNCSYLPADSIDSFVEALIISMSGCGVGFSVEGKYVEQFPRVKRQTGVKANTIVVPDTTGGWADSLRTAMQIWFDGSDVDLDLSELRPAGSPLKVKGGRSSGPEPFRKMLDFVRGRILARQGSFLRPIDAHDIMCAVGNAAVSGGVRRTAMISLFDYDDAEMRFAKHGDFERENSQRWNSNNSVVLPEGGLTQQEFMHLFLDMADSGRGEPGIFSRKAAQDLRPARRDNAEFGTNPCITGDTWVAVADGRGRVRIKDLVQENKDVDVFSVKNGELVVRKMRNPRKTGTNTPIFKVSFADGTNVRVTANHKFILLDGSEKMAVDLVPNDALKSMTVNNLGYDKNDKTTIANYDTPKTYRMINFKGKEFSEHRFVYRELTGNKLDRDFQLHHKDFNSLNNAVENLLPLSRHEHKKIHDVKGDKNPNSSGISNEELKSQIASFIAEIGHRPSVKEYWGFAQTHKMPQSFQDYRKNYFGANLQKALENIASELGYSNPPYSKFQSKSSDLQVYYKGSVAYVTKKCKFCGNSFDVEFRKREIATCGYSCANKLYYKLNGTGVRRQGQTQAFNKQKEINRKKQISIYNDMVVLLGRHPLKKEWIEECRRKSVSPEISRVSSPFRYWNHLQSEAVVANHRVVSVELDGYEDVYNGTVDETHSYFTIGNERILKEKTQMSYVLSKNCGEIVLKPMELCNLSIAIARREDNYESLREKVEVAAIIGTIQSMATKFPGLRDKWRQNGEEERLLGVDINGQLDSPICWDRDVKERLLHEALMTNRETAKQLGINPSVSVTCVKPSGNSSQLFNCSSGIHTRWSPFYIRNARVASHSPIYKVLRDAGVPMDPENGQTEEDANTWVVHFPMKSPDGAITRKDRTAIQQCEFWLQNKLHWTEHNPSVTITYYPHELLDLMKWVWEHIDLVGGMTFLPAFDAQYAQMPYMEITKEEYEALAAKFPKIDFSKIYRYEEEDLTKAAQEIACLGGACEVDFIPQANGEVRMEPSNGH